MAAFEQPISRIYLYGQEKYKTRMENIIGMNTNLDQFTDMQICDCTLELTGYQVPFAGAIRKMKNLTTLRLNKVELYSSTFLEIESKELKQLYLCRCETQVPIASLFKNDLCYKDSLVELNLEENQWSCVPNGIFQFQNLLKLSLRDNRITELPDKFTNLSKLQQLELSHNQLTLLPLSIFECQNLSLLALHNNHITELPDMFTKLSKLNGLFLCDNQLRNLPPSIFALQNLSVLLLRNNLITELPDKFANLSNLEYLFLSYNQLQYLPPSICSLNLNMLDIASNPFNFEIPPPDGSEMYLPSLKELSYRAILNHKLKVKEGMLPKRFLKDLANYKECVCGCKFVERQDLLFLHNLNDNSGRIWFDLYHLLFPIRGNVCNSFKSCLQDRFT